MDEVFIDADRMMVQRLIVGPLDNNCFIVACRATRAAAIIDAADDAARIVAACRELEPLVVLTTHGHADHVGAAVDVGAALDIDVALHPADVRLAGLRPDRELADADSIPIGQLSISVLHTPGHTPGSVCFSTEGHLFSGDTLFPGGPGATRFPYSDFDQIMASLDRALFTLPDATPFHPGHGESSTIGRERPHLESWRQRRW